MASTPFDEASSDKPREGEVKGRMIWAIDKFMKTTAERQSADLETGEVKWRVRLLYQPDGNPQESLHIAITMVNREAFPGGFRLPARLKLRLFNKEAKKSYSGETDRVFTRDDFEVSFVQQMRWKSLLKEGFIFGANEALTVKATVTVRKTHLDQMKNAPATLVASTMYNVSAASSSVPRSTYYENMGNEWSFLDSKKETGCVGLKNQGATCYLNSLLQCLYHTGPFREAVYQMPTAKDVHGKSIALALQRIFMKLQLGEKPVGTKELTSSFGWDRWESALTQHDVQEMSRVLMDKLEEKMKGTPVEGTITRLFQGRLLNFIKCLHVPYQSSRVEPFYDVSLNVKGCKDLLHSFEKYVEVELLEKENKYQAEGHGLQDAEKGCIFLSLPPVLQLQLKRFEYDPMKDSNVKVNDRYEFPPVIDLAKFLNPDAGGESADFPRKESASASVLKKVDSQKGSRILGNGNAVTETLTAKRPSSVYHLFGVLVHRGDVGGGHYYAFFKPNNRWLKFDDKRVSIATEKEAIEDNFGGETELTMQDGRRVMSTFKKSANAYMLVYIRETELQFCKSAEGSASIPPHLMRKFEEDRALKEVRRREKAEEHLYTQMRVLTDYDLRSHTDFDLHSFSGGKLFRVKRTSTLRDFKSTIQAEFGIDQFRQRFWTWVTRQNKTYRPDFPVQPQDELKPLTELKRARLDFFLEISPHLPKKLPSGEVTNLTALFPETTSGILLFFKYYDCKKCEMEYVSHKVVPPSWRVCDLAHLLNEMKGFAPHTPLLLFEEVRPTMVNALRPEKTLKEEELQHGDIVIFQQPVLLNDQETNNYPLVIHYCEYLLHRVTVNFIKMGKKDAESKAIELSLSLKMTHDQVATRLAERLLCDPFTLRFTAPSWNKGPMENPIKRTPQTLLENMLVQSMAHSGNVLYYEVLDFSIMELENKQQLRVTWMTAQTMLADTYSFLLPKTAKIADVIAKLRTMVPLQSTHRIRIMEVNYNRIEKVYMEDTPIANISETLAKLRAEEMAPEEISAVSGDKLVKVVHLWTGQRGWDGLPSYQLHGNPFMFLLKRDETMGEMKKRLQTRLGLPEDVWGSSSAAAASSSSSTLQQKQEDEKRAASASSTTTSTSQQQNGSPAKQAGSTARSTRVPWRLSIVAWMTRQITPLIHDDTVLASLPFSPDQMEMLALEHPATNTLSSSQGGGGGYGYKRKEKAIKIAG